MSGSFWAPIVIPIVALPLLFIWIIAMYHADSHPGWRSWQESHPPVTAPSTRALQQPGDAQAAGGASAPQVSAENSPPAAAGQGQQSTQPGAGHAARRS